MDTLYDLLGALPNDNAEELRIAFRRAVKGSHPDINPGDPDAALKFRQIVRANDILADPEQRAAYDHLLDLAQLEQRQSSKHAVTRKVHKVASSVVALAVVSIVASTGYALFTQISEATVAPADEIRLAAQIPVQTALPPAAGTTDGASAAPDGSAAASQAIVPIAVTTETIAPSPPPEEVSQPLDLEPHDAKSFHARGMLAYHVGDLHGAIADFDQALRLDPKFAEAYVDRGIVYYRMKQFDHAFADLGRAKRLEKVSHVRVPLKKQTVRRPQAKRPAMSLFGGNRFAFVAR